MDTGRNDMEDEEGSYSDEDDNTSGSEGPGEGCYSVCLSKEIKKLHEEINAIGGHESGGGQVDIPGIKRVEKTTSDNSAKLDELLKVVQNITVDAGSSKELDELRRELATAEATIAALKRENGRLGDQLEKVSKEIKVREERIKSLQESLVGSERECRESLARLNETIKALEDELTERSNKVERLEEENAALKKKLEESKGLVDKLKEEVEEEKKIIDEGKKRVEEITNSLAEEEKKRKESEDRAEDLSNQLIQEKTKADANKKVIADLEKEIGEEKKKREASEASAKDLVKQLEREEEKLRKALARQKEAERKLREAIEKTAKCEEKVEKLTKSLEAEKTKQAKCSGELEAVKGELAEEEAVAKGLTEKLAECENISEQKKNEAKEQFENMKKDLDQLLLEKTALTKEVEACRRKQIEMEKKVSDLEKMTKGQKVEIEDLTKKNNDLSAENAKLKAQINGGSGEDATKLKEENENLKKEIKELELVIGSLSKGQKSVAVDFAGATFGATSESAFCEAEKAFTGDHYSSWTSSEEAPQTIWIQLKKAMRMTRFSFKCSVAPTNGASKFEIVAANDAACNARSNWDVIYQDLSGKGFASDDETMMAEVDSCKLYNCYGIRVLDVNNTKGQKWVIMSEVKMWTRA